MQEIICYDCGFYSTDNVVIEECKKDNEENCICPKCEKTAFVKDILKVEEWDILAHLRVLQNFR